MKKLLLVCAFLSTSLPAFAKHLFTVCYVNKSSNNISYINNGISRKWKERGELVGDGTITPGQSKCFGKMMDETVFSSDIITFYVNNKWFGIVNPGFAKPYVIAQDATAKSGGKLIDNTNDGVDNYSLYINVMPDNSFLLSNVQDSSDIANLITPRRFK